MKKLSVSALIKTIIVFCFGITFLLPLLWMISASLKTPLTVFDYPIKWIPDTLNWGSYIKVWGSEQLPFLRMYANSIYLVVFTLIGQMLISSLAAYTFAKLQFKGKNILFLLLLGSMMVPAQVTIIPRWMLFKSLGLYNNLWAIILPSWFNVTAIFLLRQFYMALPNDLVEAAKIDGASHLRIWWQILMPLVKPAIVSLLILGFISTWNEYLAPLIFLPDAKNYTVALGIRAYMTDLDQEWNVIMAAATSAIIPILILFVAMQKHFIEGIATAGMKE